VSEPRAIVVVGIDVGGTKTNATVLDVSGAFLVDRMVETASRVGEGPEPALEAIAASMETVLAVAGVSDAAVLAVGLDTPGPASATGVISTKGATNFQQPVWRGYDIRSATESRLGLPVIYNNDANAAALYAHEHLFGAETLHRSSVSAIVGTGLGGGIVEHGRIVRGACGMAGEFGHVQIPLDGVLEPDQPAPRCNCGLRGDLESIASLTGIERNLLPYWLSRYPGHPLAAVAARSPTVAARDVRRYGEEGDELALHVFAQQAAAIGKMFSIAANYTDPDAYFVGGGVVESAAAFRDWFLENVRTATSLRDEQRAVARFAVVADLDMAGARGSALAALRAIRPERDLAV
jgi:predicted NBD/HSP70 family sugar kinase